MYRKVLPFKLILLASLDDAVSRNEFAEVVGEHWLLGGGVLEEEPPGR